MGLKFRFASLITFFVSLVLVISFTSIFLLYYNFREEEFFDRVAAEGDEFAEVVNDFKDQKEADEVKILKGLHNNTLYNQCLEILDSNGVIINSLPDTFTYKLSTSSLSRLKKIQREQFYKDGKQFVLLYKPETNNYIVSAGYDISGIKRLTNLKYILLAVFFCAVFIAAFVSFSFVTQLLKPLTKLSNQINHINEAKLSERVEVTKGNDEIAQIGKNFNSLLERLSNAFETQKNFVHHASHELRTPLATMYSQTESALRKELTIVDHKLLLSSLKEDQLGLIELTNSLLLLSQYEKLNKSKDWPEIRIDEVILDTISISKKTFPSADIDFSFDEVPDSEDDIKLKGNETLLKSAFGNLIKNGYLYSLDKRIQITISEVEDYIFLHFDTVGNEINATIDDLITPFYRGHNTTNIKGFGLGLSIVDRILKLHNSQLSYSYIDQKINRFTIRLHKANKE